MPTGVYVRTEEYRKQRSLIKHSGLFQKGVPKTDEVRNKISLSNTGKVLTKEHIQKSVESRKKNGWFKDVDNFKLRISKVKMGVPMSEQAKKKLSEIRKTEVLNGTFVSPTKGKHHSIEHRRKIGDAHKGEKSYLWKGGISLINKIIRSSLDFKLWREAVFKRDDWTCVWCKIKGGELHPDHIKIFADYPDLRFDINNGQTLCKNCHKWKTFWDMKIYRNNVPKLNIIYG